MTMPALFAMAWLAASSVQVQGTSRCPTPGEVAAVLPELLPAEQDISPTIVWIETAGLDLAVTMRSATGQVLFSRRLTSHGTCAELATVAAVVIASWTIERDTDISLQQPGVPANPAPSIPATPAIAARPEPSPTAIQSRRERHFDLGLGLGGTGSRAGFVGAGRVELGLRGGWWGVRVGLVAETAHDQALETGSMAWRRTSLSAGPTLTWAGQEITVESRADLLLGMTTVAGHGYDTNRRSKAVAPGLALAGRLGLGGGRWRPWLEISGQAWLAEQVIALTRTPQPDANLSLPRVEARALLGLSLLLSP